VRGKRFPLAAKTLMVAAALPPAKLFLYKNQRFDGRVV
jgi:hypothetical protein